MHHTSLQNEELARAARREMEPPPGERPRVSGGGVWARGLVRPTLVGHLPGVKGWRSMLPGLPHMASPPLQYASYAKTRVIYLVATEV